MNRAKFCACTSSDSEELKHSRALKTELKHSRALKTELKHSRALTHTNFRLLEYFAGKSNFATYVACAQARLEAVTGKSNSFK